MKPLENRERRRKRLVGMVAAGGLLWLGLIGRLVQVQGFQHQVYLGKARGQHERKIELKARRGPILDRRGRVLAVDVEATSFYANPALVDEPAEVARHFAPFSPQKPAVLEQQLRGGGSFVYLARQMDEEEVARLEGRSFNGVFLHPETRRNYPQGSLAGQLLGYTNIDNRGSEGLEWAFEDLLQANDGAAVCQVDARGEAVPGSRLERRKAEDGSGIMLTIDAVYQDILEQELERAVLNAEGESGMGIIANPRTGGILAMANVPLYDPNEPISSEAQWRRNRTVTDAYEPGSTFKVVTAAAVIEDRLANLTEKVFCENGRYELANGDIIRDTQPHENLTLSEVLEKSSNIGTIKFAHRLAAPRFYEYVRRFGFATRTGIGLPAESAGLFQEVGEWSDRSQETLAIGQEISVTALQLVQCFGAIANDGLLMAPQIVKGTVNADGRFVELAKPQPVRQVISPASAATLKRILTRVVSRGSGKRARIEGISIAGKTGTAQQAAADGKGYDPDKNVVSFIGFLPAENPQLLCLIVVDNPQRDRWGGHIAAPAFKRVMERILYLPGESEIVFQRQEQPGQAVPVVVPDLRGMRRRAARSQAGLRGLPVTFSGEGEIVIAQSPEPGFNEEGLVQVSCVLGDIADLTSIEVEGDLMRQAHLLQILQRPKDNLSTEL